jgi:hypothetical protein
VQQLGLYSIIAPDVATMEIGTDALFNKALAMKSKNARGVTVRRSSSPPRMKELASLISLTVCVCV